LGGSVHTIEKNIEALVVATKETGLEVNAEKLSSCLEIRMLDEVTIQRLIVVPLKGWKISNTGEQPQQINIPFRKKLRTG